MMLKFLLATVFMVHIMACGWAYIGINWKGTKGYTLEWEQTWLAAYQLEGSTLPRLYAFSLYVAVVAMFGGVGSIAPANYSEYVVYTVMMLFGASVWAWVIGSLCGILATLNPHETAFQNLMDGAHACTPMHRGARSRHASAPRPAPPLTRPERALLRPSAQSSTTL